MIKYRIFFVGAEGKVQDAYENNLLENDIWFSTPEEAAQILQHYMNMGWLARPDLVYVILPCFLTK